MKIRKQKDLDNVKNRKLTLNVRILQTANVPLMYYYYIYFNVLAVQYDPPQPWTL